MKKIIYFTAHIILFLTAAFSCFAIINLSDLIKYTTDTEGSILYGDTNYYLYRAIWIGIFIATIAQMLVLNYYKDKILKKR
jgi:hypothetical protein